MHVQSQRQQSPKFHCYYRFHKERKKRSKFTKNLHIYLNKAQYILRQKKFDTFYRKKGLTLDITD